MKPPPIRYQAQLFEHGCALACLAMILSKDQRELNREFLVDFSRKGTGIRVVREYLADAGLSIIEKRAESWLERLRHNKRMFQPFAHAHVLLVQPQADVTVNHVIVMDKNGRLYDPGRKGAKDFTDYYHAISNLGVFWD